MIEVFHVPSDLFPAAWGDVSPFIAPVVELTGGRHTVWSTLQRLQAGHMQALMVLKDAKPIAVCIVQVAKYPAAKWLQVPFCGGREMKSWLGEILDEIDKLAYENNCVGVEISGRGGWVRVLRKYGYSPDKNFRTLLVKPLGTSARNAQKRAAE